MKKAKNERLKFCISDNKHIDFKVKKIDGFIPRHWHNYFELEIIVGGRGKEIICGKECDIFPGCGYLLSMGDYHSVELSEELEIFQLSFDESFLAREQLERILTNKSLPFFVLSDENFEIIKNLYLVCKAEYETFSYKSACLRKMVECLITKILDSFSITGKGVVKEMPESLKKAVLYIHTYFQKPITLEDVAESAKYNSSYFSTVFHAEFGMTFSEYLSTLRINYAKQILISTDEGVEQIGKRCGFSSSSAFLRAFKRQEKMTPTDFRKINN